MNKPRLIFMLALLLGAGIWGGWYAVMAVVILVVIPLGIFFPYHPEPEQIADSQQAIWERVEHARRGSEIDPTRPHDDHPLLLTREFKRRQ